MRFWWNRFGPMFAAAIRKQRVKNQSYSRWRWHLDEVFVKIKARHTISGGLLITRARCSRCSPPSAGIGGLRLSF